MKKFTSTKSTIPSKHILAFLKGNKKAKEIGTMIKNMKTTKRFHLQKKKQQQNKQKLKAVLEIEYL